MKDHVEPAIAHVEVVWKSHREDGREFRVPTATVFTAGCKFRSAGENDSMGIILERLDPEDPGSFRYKADFPSREFAYKYLRPGAELLLTDGPVSVVGTARVTDVLKDLTYVKKHPYHSSD